MPSTNKPYSIIDADVPGFIYPALIHLNLSSLINKITLQLSGPLDPTTLKVFISLSGLTRIRWEVEFDTALLNGTGDVLYIYPRNPPIAIPADWPLERKQKEKLSVFIGEEIIVREIEIAPPFAVPNDIGKIISLGAFIFPNDHHVMYFVRQALNRIGKNNGRVGFTSYTPAEAGKLLYDHMLSCKEPFFAWEAAPWSHNSGYQLLRMPEQIMKGGNATCIDLALFFCASIEYIRRLPVLIGFDTGDGVWHIVAGIKDDRSENNRTLIRDVNEIRQFCSSEKVYLFDLTEMINGIPAKDGHLLAQKRLAQARDAFLLDIQALREAEISSLPVAEVIRSEPVPLSYGSSPGLIHSPPGVPEQLIMDIQAGKCILLTGDMLNSDLKISRQDLEGELSELAGLDKPNLRYASGLLYDKHSESYLRHRVLSFLSQPASADQTSYHLLKELPFKKIISFYPDPILEKVLENSSDAFRIMISDSDLAGLNASANTRELYLLSGSGVSGRGLTLRQSDYDQQISRLERLAKDIRFQMETNTILMMGCDLKDTTLQNLYLSCISNLPPERVRRVFFTGDPQRPNWAEKFEYINRTSGQLIGELSKIHYVPQYHERDRNQVSNENIIKSPFKYLDPYGPEDDEIFFGRDDESDSLYRELISCPGHVLTLFGKSGVGKTSIVSAGLIPRLRREKVFAPVYCRFGSNPEVSVINAFIREFGIPRHSPEYQMPDIPALIRKYNGDRQGVVIIIDQTEEAFFKLGREVLKGFFRAIQRLLSHKFAEIRFVFVVREDYLLHLSTYKKYLPVLLDNVKPLTELSREAAVTAIHQAALISKIELEDTLIERILDDLSADLILPAHLQIICNRMLMESREKWTLDLYTGMGSASRILGEHLNNALSRVPPDLLTDMKKVLKVMVTSENTKDLLSRNEIRDRTGIKEQLLDDIIYQLIHSHRLLREVKGEITQFELSHESLAESISEWIESRDRLIRQVQEIVEQETSSATRFPNFKFQEDRLALIVEHQDKLQFSDESIQLITQELLKAGELPVFWKKKLSSQPFETMIKALYNVKGDLSTAEMADTLLKDISFFYHNVLVSVPEAIKEQFIRIIFQREKKVSARDMKILASKEKLLGTISRAIKDKKIINKEISYLLFNSKGIDQFLLRDTKLSVRLAQQILRDGQFFKYLDLYELPQQIKDRILAILGTGDNEREFNYELVVEIALDQDVLHKCIMLFVNKGQTIREKFFTALGEKLGGTKIWNYRQSPGLDVSYENDCLSFSFNVEYDTNQNPELICIRSVGEFFVKEGPGLFIRCFSLPYSILSPQEVFQRLYLEFNRRHASDVITAHLEENKDRLYGRYMSVWYSEADELPLPAGSPEELNEGLAYFLDEYWDERVKNYFIDFFEFCFNASFNEYLRSLEIDVLSIDLATIIKFV